ncbi:enolase C-terminal domain-like protein [Tenggerimyces flavus]|uniref:Enolase C-terminal domain-like protein n=1 Tax=Tenggerimyces flavus TaxID=1708749 RepID=A0ABV7YNZ8_9ACTN|nr:enolase C-terminal domain-like protein [Tenggerimyces flavus]MBM7790206.1 L-alanine-DL-glutamate epimerase-like enolase superfamily enzyme [Tenggerimyces flavus]
MTSPHHASTSGTVGASATVSDVSVTGVSASVYTVPTESPEADGTFGWTNTTLVLVQVSAGGQTGLGWTYGSVACATVVERDLASVICGRDAFDVVGAWSAMVDALRNLGRPGVAGMALSAVDCALWDLKARLLGVPLHRLLGRAHSAVPIYGSGGFTTYTDDALAAQLRGWVENDDIPRVKIKIGESRGQRVDRDLARVEHTRRVVGSSTELFVDANGGYTIGQAVRVGRHLDELGVSWFEEPVSSDDLAGLRQVRDQLGADVTAGEYGYDLPYFERMCRADAIDCLQVDITRCGGLTELLRVAAVAAAHGLQISGHCAPHLHLEALAAVPNLRHQEWFHDHVLIERRLFAGTADPSGGIVTPNDRPGLGLAWRAAEAESFRVA